MVQTTRGAASKSPLRSRVAFGPNEVLGTYSRYPVYVADALVRITSCRHVASRPVLADCRRNQRRLYVRMDRNATAVIATNHPERTWDNPFCSHRASGCPRSGDAFWFADVGFAGPGDRKVAYRKSRRGVLYLLRQHGKRVFEARELQRT